jgi:hypothetical protein
VTDVVERLAAANPVTDEQAGATGAALPPLPPRRRDRRRIHGRLAAPAVALAAALTLLGVTVGQRSGRDEGGRPDVAAAAAATLDPGPDVLHVVTRVRQRGPGVPDGTRIVEVWSADEAVRVRTTRPDGTVVDDAQVRPAAADAGSLDPLARPRAMLRAGILRPVGRAVTGGRPVQRFATRDGRVRWDFEATTLEPVRSVLQAGPNHGRWTATTDFLRYDRLRATSRTRRALTPPQPVAPRPRP